ncbi:RsmE family RNA methyltransferase [Desulfuromonas sp.]|uniref:RsmE family RNA methyltransferase n=1 Tax=Desulfuromonas sp. TaxID=892 RepID=UPI0025C5382B|nr:RsmE family RNA methyltransferase [Desulfuromonas sp.]
MSQECVNKGGPKSLIRLDAVPALETEVTLSPKAVAAVGCWEARPGEVLTCVDPEQGCYRARLASLDSGGGVVVPFEKLKRPAESLVTLEVFQALPEKERFELILQKLTEIGVARIVPFVSERSTTPEERDAGQKKSHRWPDVVLRAAKQCRRAVIPELFPVVSWDEALYRANHCALRLMLYEGETSWTLREALEKENSARIALLVGPEGGFSEDEVEEARAMGFLPVSVGPRILRTETAAIVGAAVVQFALGDLG